MVDLARGEAARAAREDERGQLAKVLSAAIRGDTDTRIEMLPYLLPTERE
jgi:hypothetical protein